VVSLWKLLLHIFHIVVYAPIKTGQVTKIFISMYLAFLVEQIDEALQEGVDALKLLLSKGFTESAKRFNKEQKYKHLRVQNLPV